jgi:hypothetical protein
VPVPLPELSEPLEWWVLGIVAATTGGPVPTVAGGETTEVDPICAPVVLWVVFAVEFEELPDVAGETVCDAPEVVSVVAGVERLVLG